MFAAGCLAFHMWLTATIVRARLREIPEARRSQMRLLIIRNSVRRSVPSLLLARQQRRAPAFAMRVAMGR